LLGAFFAFSTAMCALAGTSLLTPGGPLDWIWRMKPTEHRELLEMGPAIGAGFLGLALVMALASFGSFTRRRWAWPLAVAIFAVNAVGDAARIPFGAPAEGLVGVAVTVAILWAMTRPAERASFDR
jgi:hypothetical protein